MRPVPPGLFRLGVALSLALRADDRVGAELLMEEARDVGEVLDVSAVAGILAPRGRYGDVSDAHLRRVLLDAAS